MSLYTGPYTTAGLLRPNTSNGKPQRVGSSYVRQLSVGMLISQENIRLLECIGQGKLAGVVLQATFLSCVFMYLYFVVCVCAYIPHSLEGRYEIPSSQGLLNILPQNLYRMSFPLTFVFKLTCVVHVR